MFVDNDSSYYLSVSLDILFEMNSIEFYKEILEWNDGVTVVSLWFSVLWDSYMHVIKYE